MSLKHHWMQLPREVIIGEGVIERVAEISKKLGFTDSALIITGSKTYEVAGKAVEDRLIEEEIKAETMLVESATLKEVEAVEAKIRSFKPQVVFGVGGGTKIDVAKLSSARQGVPFISVSTTASHDGIASPLSSVKGFEKPFSVMAHSPIAIVADTNLIMQAPYRFIASGCGDVVAKFTAVRDWRLAYMDKEEYYGDYAASLALMSAKLVMKNASLIRQKRTEGLRVLLEALISCGVSMSIAGSSRPCSGSEHLFSHALETIKPNSTMHGERCGVGTILMAYVHGVNWKRIKETLKAVGAPTNAYELGLNKEDVVNAFFRASSIRPERYTILNKLNLSIEECEKIAKVTDVI
ncbi:MAG: NAD(P)-dependent glycerol-1-phosphate dehydrogenase [Candidatus Bathyarchaeia archaeon]